MHHINLVLDYIHLKYSDKSNQSRNNEKHNLIKNIRYDRSYDIHFYSPNKAIVKTFKKFEWETLYMNRQLKQKII
jgi:hypothetical protein